MMRSETCKKLQAPITRTLIATAVSACFVPLVFALPLAPSVVNGSASFVQNGNTLTVTNSNQAIINWQSFSIGSKEITSFVQPSANSSVLNRVLGNDPSQLLGALQSNGRVFLINPAGVLVGQGARVDVAGFAASTLNLSNSDFLANRLHFTETPGAGKVQNLGEITTPGGGNVYLVAPQVENGGIISAPNGEVLLAAGQRVELIDTAMPGVRVAVVGSEGNATNLGTITAEAGRIGIAGVLVKNSGTLNASSVVSEGGRIFLKASGDTLLTGDSRISATGAKGGAVEVLGQRVALTDHARIDASGQNGGGSVLVGGDYQGKNVAIQNSRITYFGKEASIQADALENGDGGKVIVWADDTTRAYGSISARGGARSGDGGFVEVSGKQQLTYQSLVDTSAPQGKTGTLLLDPTSISLIAGTGTDSGNTIYGDNILSNLNSSNVILQTGSGGTGNITFTAGAYDFSSATTSNSLNLLAYSDGGTSTGDISLPSGTVITMKAGAPLTMVAGWDGVSTTSPSALTGFGSISVSDLVTATGGIHAIAGNNITASGSGQFSGNNVEIKAGGTLTPKQLTATGQLTINAAAIDFENGSVLTGSSVDLKTDALLNQSNGTTHGGITSTATLLIAPRSTSVDMKIGQSVIPGGGGLWLSNQLVLTPGTSLHLGSVDSSYSGTTTVIDAMTMVAGKELQLRAGAPASAGTLVINAASPIIWEGPETVRLSAGSGGVQISDTITNTPGTGILSIDTGGTVSATAAGIITASGLAVKSGGNVTLDTAVNMVDKLAASVSGTNSDFKFVNGKALNVDAGAVVDNLTGISISGTTGNYDSGNPNGVVSLRAVDSLGSPTAWYSITQSAGALLAGKTVHAIGLTVDLQAANPTGVIAGEATGGSFKYKSSSPIFVTSVGGSSGIQNTGIGGDIVLTSTNGGIGQDQPISTKDVPGGGGFGLSLSSTADVMLQNAGNNFAALSANVSAGSLTVYNSENFTVGTVNAIPGISTNNTNILLAAGTGKTLTVSNAINAGITSGSVSLLADDLALNDTITAAMVDIRPVTLGRPISVGSNICGTGCLNVIDLWQINAPSIGIGSDDPIKAAGAIAVSGITVGSTLPTHRLATTTRIGLLTGAGITQSGAINVQELGISAGGTVNLNVANSVSKLAGKTSADNFTFTNSTGFEVTSMSGGTAPHTYGMNGIFTDGGAVSLSTSAGNITLNQPINAGSGAVSLTTSSGSIQDNGNTAVNDVIAGSLTVSAAGTSSFDAWGITPTVLAGTNNIRTISPAQALADTQAAVAAKALADAQAAAAAKALADAQAAAEAKALADAQAAAAAKALADAQAAAEAKALADAQAAAEAKALADAQAAAAAKALADAQAAAEAKILADAQAAAAAKALAEAEVLKAKEEAAVLARVTEETVVKVAVVEAVVGAQTRTSAAMTPPPVVLLRTETSGSSGTLFAGRTIGGSTGEFGAPSPDSQPVLTPFAGSTTFSGQTAPAGGLEIEGLPSESRPATSSGSASSKSASDKANQKSEKEATDDAKVAKKKPAQCT